MNSVNIVLIPKLVNEVSLPRIHLLRNDVNYVFTYRLPTCITHRDDFYAPDIFALFYECSLNLYRQSAMIRKYTQSRFNQNNVRCKPP